MRLEPAAVGQLFEHGAHDRKALADPCRDTPRRVDAAGVLEEKAQDLQMDLRAGQRSALNHALISRNHPAARRARTRRSRHARERAA